MSKITTYIVTVFIIIIFSTCGRSQHEENFLFWEISGNGLEEPSFLLGTLHSMHYSFIKDSIPLAWNAFHSVNQLIPEANPYDFTIYEKNKKRAPLSHPASIPEKTTINYNEYLNKDDFALLDSICKSTYWLKNIDLSNTNHLPLQLLDMIKIDMERIDEDSIDFSSKDFFYIEFRTTTSQRMAMDYYFTNKATGNNYSIIGLDEPELKEQLYKTRKEIIKNYITNSKLDTTTSGQAKMLIKWLKKRTQADYVSTKGIVDIYMRQEIRRLQQLRDNDNYAIDDKTADKIKYEILDKRNFLWIKKLPDLMKRQSSFIMVGAGHLAGENGLINLLRRKGYNVKPATEITISNRKSTHRGIKDKQDSLIHSEIEKLKSKSFDNEWIENFQFVKYYSNEWLGRKYDMECIELHNLLPDSIKNKKDMINILERLSNPPLQKGDSMINIVLTDLDNNISLLSDYKGEYVLLHFWNSTTPLLEEIEKIRELESQSKGLFKIISINLDKDENLWKKSSEKMKITWTNLRKKNDVTALAEKIEIIRNSIRLNNRINCYLLISPEGIVVELMAKWNLPNLNYHFRKRLIN